MGVDRNRGCGWVNPPSSPRASLTLPTCPHTVSRSLKLEALPSRAKANAPISRTELSVNVTLEHLGPCKKLLRVDVDAAQVKTAFEDVTSLYIKNAALPGFRPGRAPRDMVLKKFDQDITTEVKRKLYSEVFRQAIKEHQLEVVADPDVEEIQFANGQDAKVAFTVETVPQFELPNYRGLPARRDNAKVTEEDLEKALTALRERKSTFQTVNRPAQAGDFVVVNYNGTCEGQPITALAPAARGLTEQKNFWLQLEKDSFIPGFTEPEPVG